MTARAPLQYLRPPIRSDFPGRLLARLHPGRRQVTSRGRIKKRPETRASLTVDSDRQRYGMTRIAQGLRDAYIVFDDLLGVPFLEAPSSETREAGSTVILTDAFDSVNRRLSRLTGVRVNLKKAVPLAVAGAGVWTIARGGRLFGRSSGWLLLRLAIDVFLKLHPTRR